MTEQKHHHDPLNVDEALSTSEAFLIKYKKCFTGSRCGTGYQFAVIWDTNTLSLSPKKQKHLKPCSEANSISVQKAMNWP